VNTGRGWTTWNPNGTFASRYVRESWAHRMIPVFSYYMLLQSAPAGGDERQTDLAHLHDPKLMATYWSDVQLLFRRVRGSRPVVVHVEPDLWGYLEQSHAVALARSFARHWLALRNRLAPNVYEDPPDAVVRRYAAQAAAFYRALGTQFDIAFDEYSDRDADYYKLVEHNPNTWFKPADFHRHLLFGATFVRLAHVRLVAWQIPLGNTHLSDTPDHYRDNRVQWLLGSRGRAHLRAYVKAGYAGFLFGGGATGTTSARTDGGYFFARAKAYYARGAIELP
jgi:hypothetical protein